MTKSRSATASDSDTRVIIVQSAFRGLGMSERLLVGTRKGLLILARDGGDWAIESAHFEAVPVVYAVHDRRNGAIWASLDHGHWGMKLARSLDGGASWQEIEAPKYPDGAMSPPEFAQPATTSYIWIIEPGGADEPNRTYIGTEPGGLFLTDDGGESFQLNEALWNDPGASQWFGGGRDFAGHLRHPGRPARQPPHHRRHQRGRRLCERGTAAKAGRFATRGSTPITCLTPTPRSGKTRISCCKAQGNPDVLWQQNHCSLYRSADGGRQWHDIADKSGGPAGFGFALAVDARDENVAWVAPAVSAEYRVPVDRALVICRTEDGGQTWQNLREGLPQRHCYDLVFRHALDVSGDRAGLRHDSRQLLCQRRPRR